MKKQSFSLRWLRAEFADCVGVEGEERREGEPTRAGGRCAPQALLSRSCCYGSVSLPIFRFLQSTEHLGFSSKQFSFFAQQLFRESPSRALGGSVSGVFFLSFAMLFFVMDRLPQVLFFLSSFVSSHIMVFPLEGRGDFRRWCERLCSFGLRGVRVSVCLGVFPCIYCMALSISAVSFIFWTALCVGSIDGCR